MEKRRGQGCGRWFVPSPRVGSRQIYCGRAECQRTRKRWWTQEKLGRDEGYRQNHARAQKRWREHNPGYGKRYRAEHPEYTERDRGAQRERNRRRRGLQGAAFAMIAKMDEIQGRDAGISGTYELTRMGGRRIAKMDEIIVEIRSVSTGCRSPGDDCKVMTR